MFNMYVPTRFVFGTGRLSELHQQKMPGKKAMIAISNGKSVHENGVLSRTQEQIRLAEWKLQCSAKLERTRPRPP